MQLLIILVYWLTVKYISLYWLKCPKRDNANVGVNGEWETIPRIGILRQHLVANHSSTRSSGLNRLSFIPRRTFDVYDKTRFHGVAGRSERRKAFAWVAATWVVINCDKAQTRRTRNIHASLSLSLSYPRVRERPSVPAHPHTKRHVHAQAYTCVCSRQLWITRACMCVGATAFSRSFSRDFD